jgi:hypothetical protein
LTLVGVYVGNSPAALTSFENWLGRPVDGVHGFVGQASWADFASSAQWAAKSLWGQVARPVFWSVPLIVDGARLESAASGAYNPYYKQFMPRVGFQDLVARQGPPYPSGEGFERLYHAALPIDQRAIAVEGQDFEVGQTHVSVSSVKIPVSDPAAWILDRGARRDQGAWIGPLPI